ncbi:hypothetical protein MVEN_00917800 [Mycena venus]|uniref:Cyclin N-terminal domain-containing protein n=1 Tax=Mycena venus TaxID=2733690 RepID=A0A8H6Y7U3_9AGAR|nr:hypothetical protein MVEN_00917800 [Mycena venus]
MTWAAVRRTRLRQRRLPAGSFPDITATYVLVSPCPVHLQQITRNTSKMFLKGSQASDRATLQEINQMEREMCNYLDWELSTTQYWATSRPWSSGISFQVPRGRIRHTRSYGVEALDTPTHGYSNTTSLASSPPPFLLPKTFWIKISLGLILPNKVLSVHLGCPCEGWPCTLGHPPANACTLTISAPTSCRISPQPKITWISAAIQTVFRRFWPPAVERVHTDHVSPDVPPDQPPTKTTWISAAIQRFFRRFGRPLSSACTLTMSAPTSRRIGP